MHARLNVILATLLSATVVAAGCASSGASAAAKAASCVAAPGDSVFAGGMPVFRPCAVDVQAKNLMRSSPDYRPSSMRTTCYFADLEFVVDAKGVPEGSTAHVVRTNDQGYADAAVASLPRWKYEPATIGGQPVREIVSDKAKMSVMNVIVPAGSAPPTRPTNRTPVC
jgi:hypothetical protein